MLSYVLRILSWILSLFRYYPYEFMVITAILFIVLLMFVNMNKIGTWSSSSENIRISFKELLSLPKLSRQNSNRPNEARPASKKSSGEQECMRVLHEYFTVPFKSTRPNFLRNPVTSSAGKNYNLELDCYNDELKLAVEYNGRQHYDYVPYFHKNKEAFRNQQYRDELKRRICTDNGITLIEISYTVKNGDIEAELVKKLKQHKFL